MFLSSKQYRVIRSICNISGIHVTSLVQDHSITSKLNRATAKIAQYSSYSSLTLHDHDDDGVSAREVLCATLRRVHAPPHVARLLRDCLVAAVGAVLVARVPAEQ